MRFLRHAFLSSVVVMLSMVVLNPLSAKAAPLRVVALGDSLTAGYGLLGGEDFASQLQIALKARGLDVTVDNAGVSGDTTAGGLARVDWATGGDPKPDLVIVALGGNDMLRAIEPDVMRANLTKILDNLKGKGLPTLLLGMRASPNMGAAYQQKFDRIYPDLAAAYNVPLYPFFLDGVALNPKLNLEDGIHPTAEGIKIIVQKVLPTVEKALK